MRKYELSVDTMLIAAVIFLFVFQNALDQIWGGFSYYEEVVAVMGLGWCSIYFLKNKINSKIIFVCFMLLLFCITTLASNIIYEYQLWKAVIIDLFTNIKFWGIIGFGFMVAQHIKFDKFIDIALKCAKISTVFLLVCTICDVLFDCFQPSNGTGYNILSLINKLLYPETQYLYQTKKLTLFYFHSTYLSAAIAFMLVIFSITKPVKRNTIYILISLIMLVLTGRSKSVAFAVVYVLLYFVCEIMNERINIFHFITIGIAAMILGWSKIQYFYLGSGNTFARGILTKTAFSIAKKYFPLGTGFGTFASDQAAKHYSIVYSLFGLNRGETAADSKFLNDVMWPIIIGQSGVLGSICYILIIVMLLYGCIKMQDNMCTIPIKGQWGTLVGIIYLFISSLGEPTFNNSVSAGIAFMFGLMIWWNFQKNVYGDW